MPSSIAPKPPRASLGTWARRLLLSLIVFVVVGELAARTICWYRKAPFWSGHPVWYVFYPQLRTTGVEDAVIRNDDETYDVLMLGGSTMSDSFGSIGRELREGLEQRLGRPVRVFNLAASCHNSFDSVLKYRRLGHQHFDLVVIYDGINDVRMNNAPPERFRDDYSHCIWYKSLNTLERHPGLFHCALPFLVLYTKDCVADRLGFAWFLPPRDASPESLEYGKNVRSRRPFAEHFREMVQIARDRGEPVVLMTFACDVPANYSLDAYQAMELDYEPLQTTGCPVEVWGKPEYVLGAVGEHNQVVRDLASVSDHVIFVDQERRMPHSGRYFKDCCHFTAEGCTRFTSNILEAVASRERK